jgi:gluconokinase
VLRGKPPALAAVGTSTFWHSLLGLDAEGRPVTPVYLWMDARSRASAADLRRRLDERVVQARVGTMLHWSYWPAKLKWLHDTQPRLYCSVARWVSFGEYLLQRLTAQSGVSVSMASGTGLLDTHTCQWDAPLLQELRLDERSLSRIEALDQTASLRQEFASRWPALRGVPWLLALGDGACSNIGAGCTISDRVAVMIGTSGAERVVWSPPDPFEVPWGTWCYRVDARRAVLGGAINDGGSLFDWLRRSLRLPPLGRAEAAVAVLEPDAHGLTILPFWAGERSTGWADDARGAVVGLRLNTQPEEILRAALEAIALRLRAIDQLLLAAMPAGKEVIATGGALLHSPAWLQIVADALGRPVLASAEPEASSHGAALLAMETLGLLPHRLEHVVPETTMRYEPVAEHSRRYAEAAERQRHLYDLLVAHQSTGD